MDVVFIGTIVAFLLLGCALVVGCAKLGSAR